MVARSHLVLGALVCSTNDSPYAERMSEEQDIKLAILERTTEVIASYVSNNAISEADLPALMGLVHNQLKVLTKLDPSSPRPDPAVPIKKSLFDEYIICLEDGKKLKMLKRYLRTRHGMTPDQYRERWGLPWDYPMTAPAYSRVRSEHAMKIGLGKSS